MVETWDITIPELTGDEVRRAYIYLPESYDTECEKRYPVLYMFDGHNVFFDSDATYGKCWGMKEYLDEYIGDLDPDELAVGCQRENSDERMCIQWGDILGYDDLVK